MVHSHGVRGGVVNLAPMTLGSSSMVGGWGTSGLHGRLHAFVKRALLQQLVSPGAAVCDLFCGRGTDTANWAQAGIGKYIGIDLSASALEEAKEQWEKHGQSFAATFQELDPCTGNLEILQDAGLPVDVVSCFAHLQDCFVSEEMVRLLLRNVVSLLKPGGYFFGTTPDSSTIWYKYQKAVEEAMKVGSLRVNGTLPRVRSTLYTITFENDRFQFFGSKYQLRFVDGLPAQMQQLVHFPSFIRLAEEVGLEYIDIQNLTEFYEDYRIPFASTLQSSCKNLLDQKGHPMVDSRGKLSMIATDVLSLYSTFIFKKSTRNMPPLTSLDYRLEREFKLDTDLEESSLKPDSPEMSHGYERTPETNPKDSPPSLKRPRGLSPTSGEMICTQELSHGYELTPETDPKDSSPSIKRSKVLSLTSGEEICNQQDQLDTPRPKVELQERAVNDSTSPTRRIELHPQQITDTLNSDNLVSLSDDSLLCDKDHLLHFQEIDLYAENKSSDLEDRDRSATITLSGDLEDVQEQILDVQEQDTEMMALVGEDLDDAQEQIIDVQKQNTETMALAGEDLEDVQEQFLDVQEQDTETMALAGEDLEDVQEQFLDLQEQDTETMALACEERDGHQENEISRDEEFPIVLEVVASSQRAARLKAYTRGRRTARFCRSASTKIDPDVTGQTCSVNYQSEVEQEPIDQEPEISVSAPPPFLFYERKRRTQTGCLGHVVVQEASHSTRTGSLRALRPRRSSSVGDSKTAPATAKTVPRCIKTKERTESQSASGEETGSFSSDGALAGGRGRAPGKTRATLSDWPPPVSQCAGSGRPATRSYSSAQGMEDSNKLLPRTAPELRTMTTRMTRMRSLRSSL